ncbi:MAG TPA: CDP-alcohol phosphatidyltransferase family protein [Allosphingosinicella sp.]|nr:CDP-alcohol phosphatidyltransferase family protein [Allosphingosinicella sp.]
MEHGSNIADRRPLRSRTTGWAGLASRLLLKSRITPDQISLLGILFAALGGWALAAAPEQPWLYLAGGLGIQLRLLCNMLDGLVAIEGGRKSAYGPLFNELPDRIEDSLLLIAFGWAAGLLWLGLTAALLAAITAYVRALGGALGFAQDFRGPMAKPHRMAALTLGSVAALIEALALGSGQVPAVTLWLIAAGTAWTIVRRTHGIARQLRAAA